MTVSTETRSVRHIGNGVATVFPYTFEIPSSGEVQVVLETISSGVRTTLSSSAYSISGLGDVAGGSVTYPLSGSPISSTHAIIIYREVDYTQDLDISNQSGFFPDVLENELDDIVFQTQQLADAVARSIRVPVGDDTATLELPTKTSRASKTLKFDASGNIVVGDNTIVTTSAIYNTKASVEAATISSGIDWLKTVGFTTPGDGGAGTYVRIAVEPTHPGKIQSADGAWWELRAFQVKPQMFGGTAGGLVDATSGVQDALSYVLAHKRLSTTGERAAVQQGYPILFLDDWFQISTSLTLASKFGVTIQGIGDYSSGLIFTATNSTLFPISGWVGINFRDVGLTAGTVSEGADGKADIAWEAAGARTNTCFGLTGTGGGTRFYRERCTFSGWAVVDETTTATTNDDNVKSVNCLFTDNDLVWDNTNTQAVLWAYIDCKFHHNENTFRNPGNYLRVVRPDIIDKGKFLSFTGIPSIGLGWVIEAAKFENYQNIGPATNPRWLDIKGAALVSGTFIDCETVTGVAYNKTSVEIGDPAVPSSPNWRLRFIRCNLDGEWEVVPGASDDGNLNTMIFEDGVFPAVFNQTVVAGAGSQPCNLIVRNVATSSDFKHQTVSRNFTSTIGSHAQTAGGAVDCDMIAFNAAVNAGSAGKAVPVWCPAPYELAIIGARLVQEHNSTIAFDVTLWTSSAKAIKILEWTGLGTGTSGVPTFHDKRASELITSRVISSVSSSPYIEITSAGNAGTVKVKLILELMPATI